MRIVVAFDGSDDAYAGLKLAAEVLHESGKRHEVTVTVVGWPPRLTPIWDKAFTASAALDDLHRAMATVAAAELKRLGELFEPFSQVDSYYGEGDPAVEIAELVKRLKADLLVVGITRARHHESVAAVVEAAIKHVPCPVFVVNGSAPHAK